MSGVEVPRYDSLAKLADHRREVHVPTRSVSRGRSALPALERPRYANPGHICAGPGAAAGAARAPGPLSFKWSPGARGPRRMRNGPNKIRLYIVAPTKAAFLSTRAGGRGGRPARRRREKGGNSSIWMLNFISPTSLFSSLKETLTEFCLSKVLALIVARIRDTPLRRRAAAPPAPPGAACAACAARAACAVAPPAPPCARGRALSIKTTKLATTRRGRGRRPRVAESPLPAAGVTPRCDVQFVVDSRELLFPYSWHVHCDLPILSAIAEGRRRPRSGPARPLRFELKGRPVTVVTEENVRKIEKLVLADQRIKLWQIAEELQISKERVGEIIHEHMNMRKSVRVGYQNANAV
ncbi:Putative uncharacterized protein FLJ37770 [Eumeta japonica]|uniref:Uncharacterized protein n=1 Tax=Eumeta variegata TaxID=151549 RepID=A0A4C1YFV5_EUMVA|nr:Putative uncharacterized protein FLJ37770 [Eumeta japonica]